MGVSITPPVFIHPEAEVESSVIGPHVTIEIGCQIKSSVIQNSIIEKGTQVMDSNLNGSMIGQNTILKGGSQSLTIGDNTELEL
jgi:glucose-1-phosphate thymidylyltransferase